ncbi:hypothetical protein FO519_004585 [Halicephalobus sp. NKZ332]|nr:hypothetical protein FO519_004585 [Halicephalobus sp. NKZ332]
MSIFTNRNQYQTIDGEDEAGPLLDNSPPTSHHIDVGVAYQNTGRQRQSSLSISTGPNRWDHIENLDQFFNLVYKYHQNNGFICIGLRMLFDILKFLFVICISTFLFQCVDYNVLFNNKSTDAQGRNITGKRHLSDAVIYDCPSHFSPSVVFLILVSVVVLFFQIVHFLYRMKSFNEIRKFYNTVLEIPDSQLSNVTWKTIVQRICQVQPKVHLSVNQTTISELDIYSRILRHKNYFIAMVYEEIVPPFLTLPGLGTVPYLPASMKFNLELILFKGFWSPWKNHFQLKDEFKDISNLERLGNDLRSKIVYASFINLLLMPLILVYQILYSFFSYADLVKREPGVFGMRKYSNYGREKLRHFNELDHELNLRLNRSYEFAVRYMDQFISPAIEIIAKYLTFVAGSIFAILAILTAWDEDVLTFEHVITVMSATAILIVAGRAFISNENLVFCPDFLMKQIVCNIHYAPESWLREAQSNEVVIEFGRIFHMRAYALILDIISPIFTPFILFFSTSLKAHQIVQFFHERTRSVPELGDVCSYALMDLKEDGDQDLQEFQDGDGPPSIIPRHHGAFTPKRTIRGKIELSLLNFATQNPDWKPPSYAVKFISNIREKTKETGIGQNLMLHSLKDLERPVVQSLTQSIFNPMAMNPGNLTSGIPEQSMMTSHMSDGTNDEAMNEVSPVEQSMMRSIIGKNFAQPKRVQETNLQALEMSMNALNLGDLLTNVGESDHEEEATDELGPMRFNPNPLEQQAESNIWGIPTQSQYQSRYPEDSQYSDRVVKDMPMAKVREVKEKIGLKLWKMLEEGNEPEKESSESEEEAEERESESSSEDESPKEVKTKRSCHRPREMSFKKPVSVIRQIDQGARNYKKQRFDPRFNEASGEFVESEFLRDYDFLREMQESDLQKLKTELKKTSKTDPKFQGMKEMTRRLGQQLASTREKKFWNDTKKELHEKNIERMNSGQGPVYVNNKKIKEIVHEKRLQHRKKVGTLNKYEKKMKKVKSRGGKNSARNLLGIDPES